MLQNHKKILETKKPNNIEYENLELISMRLFETDKYLNKKSNEN